MIQVADSCPAMFGGELGSTVSTGGGCQLFPRIESVVRSLYVHKSDRFLLSQPCDVRYEALALDIK